MEEGIKGRLSAYRCKGQSAAPGKEKVTAFIVGATDELLILGYKLHTYVHMNGSSETQWAIKKRRRERRINECEKGTL